MNKRVLIVGVDLSSNGGIASVVKSHYHACKRGGYPLDLDLLKTNHYQDKGIFYEFLILVKSYFQFLGYLVADRHELIHIHTSANRSFFRKSIFLITAKIFGKKVILHLHSSKFYEFFLTEQPILRRYIKWIFSMSDNLVVLCTDWENKIRSAYPTVEVRKIENPVSFEMLPKKKQVLNTKTLKLLFVGFFIKSKGIEDLLELAKRLKENSIDVCISLAGKGELESYIKAEIDEFELDTHINLLGWVSGKTKHNAYLNADVFILPSYKEGMPMSILEAMAYGIPSISTRIAGIPDIIIEGKNGFLLEPGDINGYYEKITMFVSNPGILYKMQNECLKMVKHYTADMIFTKVYKLYEEFLTV